ncbi:helicase-related protein [Propionivibrio sp.]|uniref:helicase-related protein n=1 Tax=Propionivibrio sp. TaxID=2212460 RepID=UPI003BF08D63
MTPKILFFKAAPTTALKTHVKAHLRNGKPVIDYERKPLYVSRQVLNGQKLHDWAVSQGFKAVTPPHKMHVTVAYSRSPVHHGSIDADDGHLVAKPSHLAHLGEDNDVVMHVDNDSLHDRHSYMLSMGASWGFKTDGYNPHVSISYKNQPIPPDAQPFDDVLHLGPEIVEPLQIGWGREVAKESVDAPKMIKAIFLKGGKRWGQGLHEVVITGSDGIPRKHWVATSNKVAHDGVSQIMLSSEVLHSKDDAHGFRVAVEEIAKARYANKPPVPVTINSTNEVVFISWSSAKHVLRDGLPDWRTSLAALHMEALAAASEKTGEALDYKGRKDPSGAEFYRSDAIIDGESFDVKITVRIHSDGRRYYDHIVVEKKSPTGLPESGEKITSTATPTPPFAGLNESINQTEEKINKSITLIFPNGNEHALGAGQFSFDDSLLKALEAGQRWISVHPNGPGTKGVPVMIQESGHGSGVYHVIGGAGGKLNYLKLHGVKSESSYKQHLSEKKIAKAAQKKVLKARDKELGIDKGKEQARTSVKSQLHEHQKEFINHVAAKMGWKDEELKAKIPENVSDVTRNKLEQRHHSELLNKANAAVELQNQNLLTDAQAREEAGGVATDPDEHTPDDKLTVADLDDSRPQGKSGLGFSANYAERAEEQGASEEVIKKEADAKKEVRQANMSDSQKAAIKTRGDKTQQIKAEIESIREPITANVKAVLASAVDAVDMIKAKNELRAATKAAQAANKDIDAATEVKAYNIEVSAASEDEIADNLEADLRTIRTKAFLSAIKKETSAPEKELRQHVGAGAFNSINALALTAGGSALVDRSVIDVLGMEGAARVLARRLHADLPADEMEKLTAGMEDWHVHHYMESSKAAMQEAQELHDTAKEISLGEASHGADFEAARELLHRKKACIEEAHKILGTALGEMEANAALVTALKSGRNDKPLEVPLGNIADEDAIRQARAIGLQRGDYSIDRVAGNQVLTVTPEGMDRLSKPVDREELARTKNTLDILNGGQDEDDWLPQGFAKRPDLAMNLKPGVAATLARPFAPEAGNLQQSLRDYIGGRAADGDSPGDIVADIQSSDFFQKSGDNDAYREALDTVAPLKGKDGKMARAESLTDSFNEMADSFVKREYGGTISTLQRQQFEPDAVAQDALHRALADEPSGVAAYKPIGELSNEDQRTLREHFYANVAHESPEAAGLRERLEKIGASEPEKESQDMFGDMSVNPEWNDWKAQRDTLAEEVGAASLDWQKYAGSMGGHENAYASMQDLIKSKVAKSFHENHNKLAPGAPLKLGRQVIRGNLNHLDAVDPEARKAREAKERELTDSLRERNNGKYASGSVSDKLDAERERRAGFEQSQMGFFSTEEEPDMFGDKPKAEKPLGKDERYTLGHAAERTIAGMMPLVGHNFKPGQPVKIFNPTMSGPDGIMRQRAIKIIEKNKRVILAAGAGSGKTAMFLGAFSHLQSQGKVKKGVVICPSIVQGQVGAEALRFMQPGKYKWHCDPGGSFEDRLAAYKDPDTHFSVVTHQSFRDDVLKMAAMKTGEESSAIADRMEGMPRSERSTFVKSVLDHHGINFDFSATDEGHGLLDRVGKDNSRMSNVIGGVTDNTGYTVSATADPVKNDISEAFSHLEKMDPARYNDRNAFMRRYGVDTAGAKDALKRELIRHVLPFQISSGKKVDKREIKVSPSESQTKALDELDKNIGKARMARMEGKVDVEAMKSISPSQFKDAPEAEHEAIAKELSRSLGIIKGSAVRNILDSSPDSAKIDALSKIAGERKGKPGVVFAHSLAAVENIKARLEKDGHRVMTLTGADSSADKAAKIRGFNPDKGERTHDILVASDAGSTGANLQSGNWLAQYETPLTAMCHAQRRARIDRIGQKQDVELLDLVSNHASDTKARERLKTKYELRELMSSPMGNLDDTGLAHWLHQRKVQQQNSML